MSVIKTFSMSMKTENMKTDIYFLIHIFNFTKKIAMLVFNKFIQ